MKTPKPIARPTPRPASGQSTQAVDEFLEALLEPVQEYRPAQERSQFAKPKPAPKPVAAPAAVQPLPTKPALPKIRLPERFTQPKVELAEKPAVKIPPPKPQPDPFDQPFQCLLFRTQGSEFAVPLATLSGILKWDGKSSKLPGQPSWHRGVINYREGKLGLVDLDVLLGVRPHEDGNQGFVLAFAEGRFGLLCKELLPPKTLNRDDIKWREDRGDRLWSLGTLREQLCPLMDMQALEAMLH